MSVPATQLPAGKSVSKVLRIGVVRETKVVQERWMRVGESVTLGDPSRATFGVTEPRLTKVHEIFVPRGDSYLLSVPEWIEGKIQWRDGVKGLDDLRAAGEGHKKGDVWQLQLNENVKGKLVVGDTTFLFQFVNAPPEPVRAVSPADFRPRLFDEDDPLFLGLLGSFTVVASVFLLYVYLTPIREHSDLDEVDIAADLVVDRKIEKVVLKNPESLAAPEAQEEAKEPEKAKPTDAEKADQAARAAASPTAESVQQRSLLLQALGTTGRSGGDAVRDLIGEDAASTGSLDQALAGVSGAQSATSEALAMKQGSAGGRGDASVGVAAGTAGGASTGGAAAVSVKPKVGQGTVDTSIDEGDAGSIVPTVKKYRGKIESCTQQALRGNPKLNGRVAVAWKIAKGRVSDVHLVSNETGSNEVGSCILSSVRSFRFAEDVTGEVPSYTWILSGE